MIDSLEKINLDFNENYQAIFNAPKLTQKYLNKRSDEFDQLIINEFKTRKLEDDFAGQVAYLRQQFGLPRLASGFFTNDRFAKVNVPLKDLVYEAAATPLTAGMNPAYIVPLIQNVEANTMQEMTLQELEDLADRAEDALNVRYAAVDKDGKRTTGEVKDLYGELKAQDRTIMLSLIHI